MAESKLSGPAAYVSPITAGAVRVSSPTHLPPQTQFAFAGQPSVRHSKTLIFQTGPGQKWARGSPGHSSLAVAHMPVAGRRFRSLPDETPTKRALPDTCEPTAHMYWFTWKTRECICVVLWETQTEIPVRSNMVHKLLASVVASLLYASLQTSQHRHKITFTFDYDFRVTPACSREVKEKCVQQFNFYEISGGNRVSRKAGFDSRAR